MLRAVLATAALTTGLLVGAASSAQAQGLVPCAREGGFCQVPHPTRVLYGIPGRMVAVFVRDGGVPCTNRVFGDPAPGVPKRCVFEVRGRDRGWDRGGRGDRGWDNGYREPPRGRDRGFRDFEDDFDRPVRRYDTY